MSTPPTKSPLVGMRDPVLNGCWKARFIAPSVTGGKFWEFEITDAGTPDRYKLDVCWGRDGSAGQHRIRLMDGGPLKTYIQKKMSEKHDKGYIMGPFSCVTSTGAGLRFTPPEEPKGAPLTELLKAAEELGEALAIEFPATPTHDENGIPNFCDWKSSF